MFFQGAQLFQAENGKWLDTTVLQNVKRGQWMQANSAQVNKDYRYGQLYKHTPCSPVEIRTSTHWNLNGCSITASPLVLLPSCTLLSPSSHSAFTPQRKTWWAFKKMWLQIFFNCVSLELRNLQLHKPGSVCTGKTSELFINATWSMKFSHQVKLTKRRELWLGWISLTECAMM